MCVECKVELCDDCAKSHNEAKVTVGHTLLQVKPPQDSIGTGRENYCRVHRGEVVKYYCETCNSPICLPCTFLDHKGHIIEEIKTVRQSFVEDMGKLVSKSEDNIIQLSAARDDLAELENELFLRKEATKTQVRRTVKEHVRAIQDNEARLLNEIDTFYDILSVATDRVEVEKTIFRLQHAHDFARDLLSSDTSPITQLVNRSEARLNLERAQEYELPDITYHAEKMNRQMCYLPGRLDAEIGAMVRCASEPNGGHTMQLRPSTLPANTAVLVRRCRLPRGQSPMEVLALDFLPNGDLVVLASTPKFVKVFGARGLLSYEFGDDEGELQHPSDVAVTRDGDLAITDCGLLSVRIFDPFGEPKTGFGDRDLFALPIALCIDAIGRFLVCDQAKQRVTIHRQHGALLRTVNIGEIDVPQQICSFGNKVFICDSTNGVVCVYSYADGDLQFVGKLAATPDSEDILDCSGICVDRVGSLLVSDSTLGRVHLVNGNAEIGRFVARGRQFCRPGCLAASVDGLLAVSQLPVSLGVDPEITAEAHSERSSYSAETALADVYIYRLLKSDI